MVGVGANGSAGKGERLGFVVYRLSGLQLRGGLWLGFSVAGLGAGFLRQGLSRFLIPVMYGSRARPSKNNNTQLSPKCKP